MTVAVIVLVVIVVLLAVTLQVAVLVAPVLVSVTLGVTVLTKDNISNNLLTSSCLLIVVRAQTPIEDKRFLMLLQNNFAIRSAVGGMNLCLSFSMSCHSLIPSS